MVKAPRLPLTRMPDELRMEDGPADILGAGFPDLRARRDGTARCGTELRQVFGRDFSRAEKACQIARGARKYNSMLRVPARSSGTADGEPMHEALSGRRSCPDGRP